MPNPNNDSTDELINVVSSENFNSGSFVDIDLGNKDKNPAQQELETRDSGLQPPLSMQVAAAGSDNLKNHNNEAPKETKKEIFNQDVNKNSSIKLNLLAQFLEIFSNLLSWFKPTPPLTEEQDINQNTVVQDNSAYLEDVLVNESDNNNDKIEQEIIINKKDEAKESQEISLQAEALKKYTAATKTNQANRDKILAEKHEKEETTISNLINNSMFYHDRNNNNIGGYFAPVPEEKVIKLNKELASVLGFGENFEPKLK